MFTQDRQALDRVAGRAGPGPDDRAQPGHAARRHDRGPERGARQGQRVHHHAAGDRSALSLQSESAAPNRRSATAEQAGACSSWTTTSTRARLTAAALEAVGHETRVAFDGPAALSMAETFQPNVVLLDLGLPLMDGFEVARQLRRARNRRAAGARRRDRLRTGVRPRAHRIRRLRGSRRQAGRRPRTRRPPRQPAGQPRHRLVGGVRPGVRPPVRSGV